MAQITKTKNCQPQLGVGALLLCIMAVSGCGNSLGSTVKGKLTVTGKPLPHGIITFQPVGGRGSIAAADVNSDGTYQVHTGQNRSLPPGDYAVTVLSVVGDIPVPTVQNPDPYIERLIDKHYCHAETSGLKYSIASGENVIDIDLDPPRADKRNSAASPTQ